MITVVVADAVVGQNHVTVSGAAAHATATEHVTDEGSGYCNRSRERRVSLLFSL